MNPQHAPGQAKYLWKIITAILMMICIVLVSSSRPLRVEAHVHTFVVDSLADDSDVDPGNGTCATSIGECTLRAAVEEIDFLFNGCYGSCTVDTDLHTISVPAGTYFVYDVLGVGGNVIIDGAGQGWTIIMGQGSGVFFITPGSTIQIKELTITNGIEGTGGGVNNQGDLTLSDVAVTGSSATVGMGGGIRNSDQLTLARVTVSGNSAVQGGGGISNDDGATLTIFDSTISGNSVTGVDQAGGGIYNSGASTPGTVTIDRSTLSGNTAPFGGGLFNYGETWLANVTISGNSATTILSAGGGAINNNGSATLDLKNVTISDNTTTTAMALVNVATLNIAHTIVANNTGGDCYFVGGTLTPPPHHNLDSDGTCFSGIPSNLINTNPLLGPLSENGGLTQTYALQYGSPAIDAGDAINGCKSGGVLLTTDQRSWPRTVDGDVDGVAVCDIGAFEAEPARVYLPLIMR